MDASAFDGFHLIELERGEDRAAGVLCIGERHVIAGTRYRTSLARMRKAGIVVEGIDLYDFETQYRDGAPHAVIRLNARLGDSSVNRVAASRAFEADAPVGGTTAADAAAAIEQAVNRLLPDIVGWTLDEGQKAWAQRTSSEPNAR